MRIADMYGHEIRRYNGSAEHRWPDLFGVELELESVRDLAPIMDTGITGWTTHRDDSLRDGIEFVTRSPIGGIQLQRAIVNYFNANVSSASTERSSTHIHINMTDATVDELRSMVMIMYVLEGPLFAVVGEARKWGGYAMPMSEMPSARLSSIMCNDNMGLLSGTISPSRNQERYYGFNVASVRRHGTVEFRYFPGDPTREELESWIDLAYVVKKAARSYTVTQINERVNSPEDLVAFFQEILPEQWFLNLMRASSPEEMYASFGAIASLTEREVPIQPRRDPLIFLSGPLLTYVSRLYGEKGNKYLKAKAEELGVIHSAEWRYHLDQATYIDQGIITDTDVPAMNDDERVVQNPFEQEIRRMQERLRREGSELGVTTGVAAGTGRSNPSEAFRAAVRATPVYADAPPYLDPL